MTAATVAANTFNNAAPASAASTAAPKRGTTRLPLISGMAGKTIFFYQLYYNDYFCYHQLYYNYNFCFLCYRC